MQLQNAFEWTTSAWFPAGIMILLAISARLFSRTWLAPSAFAPMMWSLFIALPLIFAPEYPVYPAGVWLIVVFVFSIQIGAFCGEGSLPKSEWPRTECRLDPERVTRWALFFSGASVLGAVYLGLKTMEENGLAFSPLGILALGNILSVARYSGEQEPALVRGLITWMYPAGLLGGMVYCYTVVKRLRLLSFAAFVPALLLGIIESIRAPSLITLCCWLSGFLAMKCYLFRGSFKLFSRRLGLVVIGLAIAGIGLYVFLDAIRAYKSESTFEIVADWGRVKTSGLGHLAVFSSWIQHGEGTNDLGYGEETFAGIFEMLRLHTRVTGTYEQPVELGGGIETNIYTIFRSLIQDFSVVGATFVCFVFGVFAGRAYRRTVTGIEPHFGWLTSFYSLLIVSPLISTVYNGLFLAWGIGWLFTRPLTKSAARIEREYRLHARA